MTTEACSISGIRLDGDWSMSGVAERFPAMAKYFATLLNSEHSGDRQKYPSDAVSEIDMAGVTGFDACGCQLLALLVRVLRQNGVSARFVNMTDEFRSKIHVLGFDSEMNLSH